MDSAVLFQWNFEQIHKGKDNNKRSDKYKILFPKHWFNTSINKQQFVVQKNDIKYCSNKEHMQHFWHVFKINTWHIMWAVKFQLKNANKLLQIFYYILNWYILNWEQYFEYGSKRHVYNFILLHTCSI